MPDTLVGIPVANALPLKGWTMVVYSEAFAVGGVASTFCSAREQRTRRRVWCRGYSLSIIGRGTGRALDDAKVDSAVVRHIAPNRRLFSVSGVVGGERQKFVVVAGLAEKQCRATRIAKLPLPDLEGAAVGGNVEGHMPDPAAARRVSGGPVQAYRRCPPD